MKFSPPSKPIPTHIISGFLGAGKTTLLQGLLAQKPEHETWAVLMNEFGQIGIDQQLLTQEEGYAVKELLGGCLCCSSQLPMQIALSRLLADNQPQRLFIEPTGLGHPAQLLEQLTEPHWQAHLALRSPITVVDGSTLHQRLWEEHEVYRDQLKAAQIMVVSHPQHMSLDDERVLDEIQKEHQAYGQQWLKVEQGQLAIEQIDHVYVATQRKIQPLLMIQRQTSAQQSQQIKQLPYHYIETAQGYRVAGWKFPKSWQFNFYDLLDLLCEQQDWLRIKAIFYTDQGWKSFNFNPEQFNYQSTDPQVDNRIEIIYQAEKQWQLFEEALLACRADASLD